MNTLSFTFTLAVFLLFALACPGAARAGVTLLVGEPFGKFGFFNPTGHAAVYLSRICAETPTSLRLCEPGEPGTVISRYNDVAAYDWIAMPPLPYFYAVETVEAIPETADDALIAELRDSYRRKHLREMIPDDPENDIPPGHWIQLMGSSYNRTVYGFTMETTLEADKLLIQHLNSMENRRRFNIFYRNCADFARQILNFYYPGAIGRNHIGDIGIMTPKNAARTLVRYADRNPGLEITHFAISQVPGKRSSTSLRGVNESLIRSRKYVIPLAVFQPWVAITAAVGYLTTGRFNPSKYDPVTCDITTIDACINSAIDAPDNLLTQTPPETEPEQLHVPVYLELSGFRSCSDVFLSRQTDPAADHPADTDTIQDAPLRTVPLKIAFHHLKKLSLIP